MFSDEELRHLTRAVDLAEEALEAGDEPFGSVLVNGEGAVLRADRNRTAGGDHTQHPEFNLARWSASHLSEAERAAATVFTSGEHCAMCSAAHAWVGLGPIVYVHSSAQLAAWRADLGADPGPVAPIPIQQVAPGITARGPVPQLEERIHDLHRRRAAAPRQG